jgi:hypothetical protein
MPPQPKGYIENAKNRVFQKWTDYYKERGFYQGEIDKNTGK